MKIKYILFLIFFITTYMANAQVASAPLSTATPESVGMSSERLQALDALIQSYVDSGKLPGGVFNINRKGKTVYLKSFGHRSTDKKTTYQNDDIFRIASMTKAFTTVGIMQLYERGQLGLDDPIFYYIPAFKTAQVLDTFNEADSTYTAVPAQQPITVRHLLTHTSGITYGAFNPGKIQIIYNKAGIGTLGISHPTLTTEEMVNKIAQAPLIFQPGERYMYGLNMEVLGRIIEVVSGKNLRAYMEQNIWQPLGLKDTDFYFPTEKHGRIVPLHTLSKQGKIEMTKAEGASADVDFSKTKGRNHFAGGGGMSSTAMDYAVFIQALLNGGTYNGQRILSRKTIEAMTADQMIRLNEEGKGYSQAPGKTFGLGFGLYTDEYNHQHSKSAGTYEWGGYFNTKFFIDPQEELTFVGMTQIVPFVHQEFWGRVYAIVYGAIVD